MHDWSALTRPVAATGARQVEGLYRRVRLKSWLGGTVRFQTAAYFFGGGAAGACGGAAGAGGASAFHVSRM